VIKARGLTRRFTTKTGPVDAVQGIALDIEEGELVGFLGPNGAGKSTTLRMLTTLLRPTSGEATVAGRDLLADPAGVRERIGYVAQHTGVGAEQRVGEELVLQGRFYGLSNTESRKRAAELADQLDLADLMDRLVGTLSGGQQRRLDIAMGLTHRPRLVFLDEPSAGLDPQSRSNLWAHVKGLGTTVFLTTHYLDEADALCDRVLVIDNGRLVADGSPDVLKDNVSGDLVTMGTTATAVVASVASRMPGAHDIDLSEDSVRFRAPNGDTLLPTLLRHLAAEGVHLDSVQVQRPTLDDVFLGLTGRSLREDVHAA
jgi:ABC-2 type transport system ATP-binding protein